MDNKTWPSFSLFFMTNDNILSEVFLVNLLVVPLQNFNQIIILQRKKMLEFSRWLEIIWIHFQMVLKLHIFGIFHISHLLPENLANRLKLQD